jgi:hypothetical protein
MSQLELLVREVPLGFNLLQVEIVQLKKALNDRLLFNLKLSFHHQRLTRSAMLLVSVEATKSF